MEEIELRDARAFSDGKSLVVPGSGRSDDVASGWTPDMIDFEIDETKEDTASTTTSNNSQKDSKTRDSNRSNRNMIIEEDDEDEEEWRPSIFKNIPEARWRFCVRLGVSIVVIVLLWATSLGMASSVAQNYIKQPAASYAVDQWRKVVDLSYDEQDLAHACILLQAARCDVALNESLVEMINDMEENNLYNTNLLTSESSLTSSCQSNRLDALDAIEAWKKNSSLTQGVYAIYYTGVCSIETMDYLNELFNDISDSKSTAYLLSSNYERQTTDIVDRAYQSALNRSIYDINYVQSKIGELNTMSVEISALSNVHIPTIKAKLNISVPTTELINCISLKGGCPDSGGALELYNIMKDEANDLYSSVLSLWGLFENSRDAFIAETSAVIQDAQNFVDLVSAADPSKIGISVGDIPSLDYEPFEMVELGSLATAIPVPDASGIAAAMDQFIYNFNASLNSIYQEAYQEMANWANAVNISTVAVPVVLEDYNPPPIQVDRERHEENSDQFLTSQAQVLNEETTADEVYTSNTTNIEFAYLNSYSFFSNLNFNYQAFAGGFEFDDAVDLFEYLTILILVLDYVLRGTHSLRILIRYWSKSAIGLPQVDVREVKIQEQVESTPRKVARFVSSTWFMVGFVGIFALVAVVSFCSVYVPLYHTYVEGCVRSESGTLLTNNSYSFSYNWAARKANEEQAEQLEKYDSKRTEYCLKYNEETTTSQYENDALLEEYQSSLDSAAQDLSLIDECVDPNSMGGTTEAGLAYFKATTGHDSPFVTTTSETRLECTQESNWYRSENGLSARPLLKDAVFNCSNIPDCSFTCVGPDREAMRLYTHQSGCTTEEYVHAALLRFILALLIYICMNISRHLIIQGVARLTWRSLTPNGFTFVGTCSRQGKMSVKTIGALKNQLRKNIARYERDSFLMLIGSMLVHIPYIIVIVFINEA